MKKFTLLFLLITSFCFAQMPNISTIWLNNHKIYNGTIGAEKTKMKVMVNISSQDVRNDQEYFIAGYTFVEKSTNNFEGKIKVTLYKNSKKGGKIYGEYTMLEEPKGNHSGTFTGKFIYTFKWNKKTQKVESQYIEFVGDWENYAKNLQYKTGWKNQ